MVYRERFNLSAQHRDLVDDGAPDAPAPAPAVPGGPFALAWRNYIKSVFAKGYMYRLSCKPFVILYIAENKTLGGREDRSYDGEALGRKMAVVIFEDMPGPGCLARRVHRDTVGMQQVLLSIAEVLQTLGRVPLPVDPDRTAAETELLLESQYEHLEVLRFKCTVEPGAPESHVFHLGEDMNAEAAMALDVPSEHRTKMMLARCLQRNDELLDGGTLQGAWNQSLGALRGRTAHVFPAPVVVPAPEPVAPPARAARGRRRGRGAAAPPAGRGRGGAPPALAAPAAKRRRA